MIPDILCDGKNGFILKNNSPESIAEDILKILKRNDLFEISNNARKTVKHNFTYDSAAMGYKAIFKDLLCKIHLNY